MSYRWSSTCRDCLFQTAISSSVTRAAVHSGDTGTHTCTASSSSQTGSTSINFNVVGKPSKVCTNLLCLALFATVNMSLVIYAGAGVHVFRGASTGDLEVPGSLPNNGIVISLDTAKDGFYFRFICRSDSMMSNVGMLIGPDGTTVTTGDIFTITHPRQPGELRVENTLSQNILTTSDQGVYTCRISFDSGKKRKIEMVDVNIGIYPFEFKCKSVEIVSCVACRKSR